LHRNQLYTFNDKYLQLKSVVTAEQIYLYYLSLSEKPKLTKEEIKTIHFLILQVYN